MTDTSAARSGANIAEFTVSELSGAVKRALEEGFGHVRLRGEVSGYRGPHASGHCYFALKDDKAKIEAVVWKGVWGRLKIKPEEGMEVIATGKISSFPGSSKYQIVIEALEPAGLGALMAQLDERKRRLAAEGLFEEGRKRPLPFLPRVIGIVTSPTGAVIRDMLHGFTERFPTRVLVWPVRVQGEGSAAEVAQGVRGFNAIAPGGTIPRPDVLIVARGGGSLEDLWGFNDESVVRAVAASTIPVISAVGHETDWTLIDLVADARAPTPTKAAEWAVPKYSDLVEETGKLHLRLTVSVRRLVEAQRRDLRAAARGLPRPDDLVSMPRQRLDACAGRLASALRERVQRSHNRFLQIGSRLPTLRSIIAAPRHRFDASEKRLGRALSGNTQAHQTRFARTASRLNTRLLDVRLVRARDRLDGLERRNCEALSRAASGRRARLERASGRLSPQPLTARLERSGDRLAGLALRAKTVVWQSLQQRQRALESQGKLMQSLSYQSILQRGFALVRDDTGAMVRSAQGLAAGQRLDIELKDGWIGADVRTATLAPPRREAGDASHGDASPSDDSASNVLTKLPKMPRRGPHGGQGSLF